MWSRSFLIWAILVSSSAGLSWAASSPSYTLVKDTLASGGERGTSPAHLIPVGVLGESLGGPMTSAGHILLGGYVYVPTGTPIVRSLLPDKPTKPYVDDTVTLTADASDPDRQPLEYQFWVEAVLVQDWSASNTASWTPQLADVGRRTLKVIVRDPTQRQATRVSHVYVVRHPVMP